MSDVWTGIFIGGAITLLVAVLAIWFEDNIRSWRDSRKNRVSTKRRDKQLKEYAAIRKLHEGTEDKGSYFVVEAMGVIVPMLLVIIVITLISTGFGRDYDLIPGFGLLDGTSDDFTLMVDQAIAGAGLIAAMLAILIGLRVSARMRAYHNHLSDFDAYEQRIRTALNIPTGEPIV